MTLKIGEVAARAGVNVQTIRYYERRGLLPPVRRSRSGYRHYDGEAVRRLCFIKRAQELGFSLAEIRELLALRVRHADACESVQRKAQAKLELVVGKIRELERMRRTLEGLVASCQARRRTDECPILEGLQDDAVH